MTFAEFCQKIMPNYKLSQWQIQFLNMIDERLKNGETIYIRMGRGRSKASVGSSLAHLYMEYLEMEGLNGKTVRRQSGSMQNSGL